MYKAPGCVVARSAELARVYPSIRRCAPGPAEGAWAASATKGGERAVRNNGGNKTNPEPPHLPTFWKGEPVRGGRAAGKGPGGRAPPAASVGKRRSNRHFPNNPCAWVLQFRFFEFGARTHITGSSKVLL